MKLRIENRSIPRKTCDRPANSCLSSGKAFCVLMERLKRTTDTLTGYPVSGPTLQPSKYKTGSRDTNIQPLPDDVAEPAIWRPHAGLRVIFCTKPVACRSLYVRKSTYKKSRAHSMEQITPAWRLQAVAFCTLWSTSLYGAYNSHA